MIALWCNPRPRLCRVKAVTEKAKVGRIFKVLAWPMYPSMLAIGQVPTLTLRACAQRLVAKASRAESR